MPHAGVCVLASLISGVSAALILASSPSYTEPRSPQGTVYDVQGGRSMYDGCQAGPCQIAYLNSVEDFCLWAPSQPSLSVTRSTEHTLVAWCTESVHGSRLIPDGTIAGARLVITPEYVQITGVGKLTNINVPADGVVSASRQGHGVHGMVVTSVYGQLDQIYDWTSFVSQDRFCFRACKPSAAACPQIRDIFGCSENVPGNYYIGVFEDCIVDATEVSSTLYQEILAAPLHHPAQPFSRCTTRGTINNAQITHAKRAVAVTSHSRSLSLGHSTPVTSCMVPTTTDTVSTTTLNATASSVFSTNASTFPPCPHNYTHTRSQRHTHRHSHHYSSTSSASSSSSYHSFGHSSLTTSLLNGSSSTSSYPVSYSSDPFLGTTAPTFTSSFRPTPASTPMPRSSLSSSEPSSLSPSSYGSSAPSSVAPPTPSVSPTTSSSTSSQSSYILSFTIPSSSIPTTSPASLLPPVSPSMSSASSSTSSQSSHVVSSNTSTSSAPTASPTSSSPTVPNAQTQISSQCPPWVNAGSVSSTPLLPLMIAILMIFISSSTNVLVF